MKLSLYVRDYTQLALDGHASNRSARINSICQRYLRIVARDCPELSANQWFALCDVFRENSASGDAGAGNVASVDLAYAANDWLGEKWAIDAKALARQFMEMTYGQQIAVHEIVERFWRRAEKAEDIEALKGAEARIEGHPWPPPRSDHGARR